MITNSIFLVLFGLPYVSLTNLVRHRHKRHDVLSKICSSAQSCRIFAYGFQLQFCNCPGDNECPNSGETSMLVQGVRYDFCQKKEVPTCLEGQIAHKVTGFDLQVICSCPDHMHLQKRATEDSRSSDYTCESMSVCKEDESCGIQTFIGSKMTCLCPRGHACVLESAVREVAVGRCRPRLLL